MFESWMTEVDQIFAAKFGGLTSEDLEDFYWWDLWNDGYTPQEAFEVYEDEVLSEY